MDTNNWRPSLPNGGDWRTQLSPASRQKIVNKIMETLKKHIPFSGPDGVKELRRIAGNFEEKIFNVAVNQTDYLRKISMKMITMETKSQNAAGSSSSITATNNGPSMDSRHLMDNNNNWRPSLPKAEPTMDTGDWRTQLPPDSRQKIINKIMETLKKHIPFSGPGGITELRRIAGKFEEKIFSSAVNQTDYLRKISVKMITMETKSQNAGGSFSSITAATNGTSMDSLPTNQGLHPQGSLPTNQTQASQLLLSQTMQNNTASGMTGSTALPFSMPLASSITNNNVTSAVHLNALKRLQVYVRMKARAKVPLDSKFGTNNEISKKIGGLQLNQNNLNRLQRQRLQLYLRMNEISKEIGELQSNEEDEDEDKKEMVMKNRTSEEVKEERELDHMA